MQQMEHSNTKPDRSSSPTASSLLVQCHQLHASLLAFQNAASAQYTPVGVGSFLKLVTAETRVVKKLVVLVESSNEVNDADSDPEQGSKHTIRSSNLGFLRTVWEMARRCRNVVALNRREGGVKGAAKGSVVDIVADMGLLWIKIVTIGERKLLFEIAKEGWDAEMWDESDAESFDSGEKGSSSNHYESGMGNLTLESTQGTETEPTLPLVKMVKDLVATVKSNKVRYRHPELLIYFPNLQEDKINAPVTKVIAMLRATGATIHCGNGDIKLHDLPALQTLQEGTDSLRHMLPKILPDLTPVLNVDCTILLALISDLSHLYLDETDAYNEPLKKQLAGEHIRPLLPKILYPGLVRRKLITSTQSAQRMREIVAGIGTPGEKARANIILGEDRFAGHNHTQQDLLNEFQKYSDHDVPAEFELPIETIDVEAEMKNCNIPQASTVLRPVLSDINWSSTMLGWHRNITTVTSNRAVAKQIESMLNDTPGDILGPDMWVVEIARSLVGKERVKR